ncbi:replication protein, partial [candidate division KSB1 bacterium]
MNNNEYTKLPNDLLEALARIRISGEAVQVLLFIIRKTLGWNKREDAISYSQFVLGTGLLKPNIRRALIKLQQMNIVFIINTDNGRTNKYRINKDYETWKP